MDMSLLAATIGLLVVLACACLLPVYADSPDDLGDGMAIVVIPKHVPTPRFRPRTFAFLAIAALLGLVFLGWQRPSLPVLYIGAVRDVAVAITRDPSAVNGYVARLHPAFLYLTVSYMVGIAVVVRASAARRLVMLAYVPLYLSMTLLAQVLMITVGVSTRLLVGPFGIEATLANLAVGGLVVLRLTFTSFALPRATVLPITRRRWTWDNVATWCALLSAVALIVAMYALLSVPSNLTTAWEVFLPRYAVCLFFAIMLAPMWLLWWSSRRLPQPGADRPPVDVVVPAYNEQENIARLLRSIDVAAHRYGGPVWVVVSNDGSADRTEQIAEAEIAAFRWARGTVLTRPNGGQSAALNRALSITGAPICVRIDADCVMGPDALVYSVPWFRDPDIGMVGAMEEPRRDTVTWFSRLRTLETLYQFRFARLAQSLVDGLVCIPGTFMVFRRAPAVGCGGFPVRMNGEDADLTMQIGRQGYRAVIDPRIRCYEDVPRNAAEFLEQRTRWARARFHIVARHVPLRCGSAGPRVWFWLMQRAFSWFSLQTCLVAPIFMLELALTHPSYRQNLATFAGVYITMDAVPALISVPFAIRHRQWRSLCWLPTHFAYAYLRRLATLEAAITLPVRPFPAPAPAPERAAQRGRARRPRQPRAAEALASPDGD
ncbi:MAG TPA: glycosyltransferase [Streptosporangiaceae bacterium]|nr:glycosyltransferase [Streptosporangiaceae bacterium]